jgi:hypothetical protein
MITSSAEVYGRNISLASGRGLGEYFHLNLGCQILVPEISRI